MRKETLLAIILLPQIAALSAPAQVLAEGAHEGQEKPGCVAFTKQNSHPVFSESIGIVFTPDVPLDLVQEAVERWSHCPGYGTDFPAFRIGQQGTQTIEVSFDKAYRSRPRCGSFVGRNIALYAFAADRRGRVQHCGSRVDGLVHELGHVLGLLDVPVGSDCQYHAMANIDSSDRDRRQIQPDECLAAGERWLTPQELQTDTEPSQVAANSTGGF